MKTDKETRERVYTVQEMASLLKVTSETIRKLARSGKLPYFMVGSMMRFEKVKIEKLIKGKG